MSGMVSCEGCQRQTSPERPGCQEIIMTGLNGISVLSIQTVNIFRDTLQVIWPWKHSTDAFAGIAD